MAAPSCDTWNSEAFFSQATVQDVEKCVQAGADPDAREDRAGRTPLHFAARYNTNPDVIARLVELGADGTARTDYGETAWDLAQDNDALRGTDAWRLLEDLGTPSHLPCDTWNSQEFFSQATAEDVEKCVQGGADPEAGDVLGRTPLHHAAAFNDNPDVTARLVELGADLEARVYGLELEFEWRPLHSAARYNTNPDVTARLVELGADLEAGDVFGRTPLHHAAAGADPDVITRLVELGADGTARADYGRTAWDLAQDNKALRGTRAWRLLNEFSFE